MLVVSVIRGVCVCVEWWGDPYERQGDARVTLRGVNEGFWSHLKTEGQYVRPSNSCLGFEINIIKQKNKKKN